MGTNRSCPFATVLSIRSEGEQRGTPGEQWLVTQENGSFREEHRTKHDAVNAAKERARSQEPAQVKVHRADGNTEYESTYGADPRRSPS